MTTLIPKFNLPNESPEIIFVVDRSGSMAGKMHLVIEALKVFLKSLPTSVKFNICSFGTHHTFLFDRSRAYTAESLKIAMDHIQPHTFAADYGGTEMLQPVQDALKRRYKDLPLEVLLLTDGEIWRQDEMFALVNDASPRSGLTVIHAAASRGHLEALRWRKYIQFNLYGFITQARLSGRRVWWYSRS